MEQRNIIYNIIDILIIILFLSSRSVHIGRHYTFHRRYNWGSRKPTKVNSGRSQVCLLIWVFLYDDYWFLHRVWTDRSLLCVSLYIKAQTRIPQEAARTVDHDGYKWATASQSLPTSEVALTRTVAWSFARELPVSLRHLLYLHTRVGYI